MENNNLKLSAKINKLDFNHFHFKSTKNNNLKHGFKIDNDDGIQQQQKQHETKKKIVAC